MAEYIGIEELHEQLIRVADGLELNTETLAKMFLYDKRVDFLEKERAQDAGDVTTKPSSTAGNPPLDPIKDAQLDLFQPPPQQEEDENEPTTKLSKGGVVPGSPMVPTASNPLATKKPSGVKHQSLEQSGFDDTFAKNISNKLESDFDLDPTMKGAFTEAMSLPARAAAAALADLMTKMPAQTEEQKTVIKENIDFVTKTYKLSKLGFKEKIETNNSFSAVFSNFKEGVSNTVNNATNWFQGWLGQEKEKIKASDGNTQTTPETPPKKKPNRRGRGGGYGMGGRGRGGSAEPHGKGADNLGMQPMSRMLTTKSPSEMKSNNSMLGNVTNVLNRIGGPVGGILSSVVNTIGGNTDTNILSSVSNFAGDLFKQDTNITKMDMPVTNLTELTDKVITENRQAIQEKTEVTMQKMQAPPPPPRPVAPPSSATGTDGPNSESDSKVSPFFDVYANTAQFG